jgi:ParB family chromosome partitioning protein
VSNLLRLLDLPDEALALVEAGTLSEGHGRALLLAGDHDVRRALARRAAAEQWSVRTLEQRARDAAADKPRSAAAPSSRATHPDQTDACATIADTLSGALGADVRVVVARGGGYRAELRFATPQEAVDLAGRVRSARPR